MNSSTDPELAIIIPCFNRKEITLNCIKRLNASTYRRFKIFVCDSQSTDGTPSAVTHEPNVHLIDAGATAWWSEAVNHGVSAALQEGSGIILVMNDDIEFDQLLVEKLMEKHRRLPDRILSPAQESPSGPFLGINYVGLSKKIIFVQAGDSDSEVDVHTTNGCCLLVPADAFKAAGFFDQAHCPQQYGDTEFQIRAARAGYRTVACPSIEIKQLGGTNYFNRIRLGALLNYEGSPVHLMAYLYFGQALFGGWSNFVFLGFRFHFLYTKSLVKVIFLLAKKYSRDWFRGLASKVGMLNV